MFIIVLGRHVSILIKSSSGPSKIKILEGPEDDSTRIETFLHVLLTMHLSIIISAINQIDASGIITPIGVMIPEAV